MKKIGVITAICILSIMFFLIAKNIMDNLNIFLKNTEYILTIIFIIMLFLVITKKYPMTLFTYLLLIIVLMNFRYSSPNAQFNFDISYLKVWIINIRNNKIIFFNLIGNLCLYIPAFLLLIKITNKKTLSLMITVFLIIIGEFIQVITKRGIFDITDILINIVGICISYLVWMFYEVYNEKRKKQEKYKEEEAN